MNKLALVLVAALISLPLAAAWAQGPPRLSVRTPVRVDGPLELSGLGFAANDAVRILLRRESIAPIDLGEVLADDNGDFVVTLHLPAEALPGAYELSAEGKKAAVTSVNVLESLSAAPQREGGEALTNKRPTEETIGLAIFTFVVGALGLGALLLSRTRPHPAVE